MNALNQCRRRNNLVLSIIPENVSDNPLEAAVISILSDIDVTASSNDVEDCHRFGKPDKKQIQRRLSLNWSTESSVKRLFCSEEFSQSGQV